MKDKTCIGSGLVCLDILIRGNDDNVVSYTAGGTCGNVMIILSYMGWKSYPIARLDKTEFGEKLIRDMRLYNVCEDFISTENGKTPVIIQRNIIDKTGKPTHKFEIKDKKSPFFLDYRSITTKQAKFIIDNLEFIPDIYFFDRISPANIMLAEELHSKGTLVFFEPSVKKIDDSFLRCVEISDIIKFADQRIQDVSFTEKFTNKLFIQTLGSKGLRFSLFGNDWVMLPSFPNNQIVDTSGAGDWTSSMFINLLQTKDRFLNLDNSYLITILNLSQQIASNSCSYESARGMMNLEFNQILSELGVTL